MKNEPFNSFDDVHQTSISSCKNKSRPRKTSVNKDKSEAQSVCCEISRLLSEKGSNTRGSSMFRKRRKRSEKFAIIGYGTQASEEDANNNSSEVESDCAFTSSDDEIAAYDRPGPENILEQDSHFTSAEKVIHKQLKNLAKETKQMKGKGARMFAKRQERMEKYVVDGNDENFSICNDVSTNKTTSSPLSSEKFRREAMSDCFSWDPDFDSKSNYNSEENNAMSLENTSEFKATKPEYGSKNTESFSSLNETAINNKRETLLDPNIKQQKETLSSTEDFVFNQEDENIGCNSFDYKQRFEKSLESDDDGIENKELASNSKKSRFRSVKPPTSTPNNQPLDPDELQSSLLSFSSGAEFKFNTVSKNKNKTWSSVKFDPTAKNDSNYKGSTYKRCEQEKNFNNISSNRFENPCTSVFHLTPVTTFDTLKNIQQTATTSCTSVKLLEKPLSLVKSQSIFNETDVKSKTKPKSVHGDFTPKSTSPQLLVENNFSLLSPKTQNEPMDVSDFNQPHPSLPHHVKISDAAVDETVLVKPKVAACMRLLDPTKGKYEPKTTTVYKQNASESSRFDERKVHALSDHRQYDESTKFNKPVSSNCNSPQSSFLNQSSSITTQSLRQQRQPLIGALAGEVKGKGAKIFEKQQKRMDNYTRESNGSLENVQLRPLVSNQLQGPENLTKTNMSQVVGEFKKKLPSTTRTTKVKNPLRHHQHFVSAVKPTADDFVFPDDVSDRASDSNRSSTSSVASHDSFSQISSSSHSFGDRGAHNENDRAKQIYLLAESNSKKPLHNFVSTYKSGGSSHEHLPPPPSYKSLNLSQGQLKINLSDQTNPANECDLKMMKNVSLFNQIKIGQNNSVNQMHPDGMNKNQLSSMQLCRETDEL